MYLPIVYRDVGSPALSLAVPAHTLVAGHGVGVWFSIGIILLSSSIPQIGTTIIETVAVDVVAFNSGFLGKNQMVHIFREVVSLSWRRMSHCVSRGMARPHRVSNFVVILIIY